jgi:copper(I)-binding protein
MSLFASSPLRLAPVVLVVGLLGSACGSDGAGGVEASGAWARTSPMSAEAGAAYVTLSSDEAVSIVSASVPAAVAGRAELHETVAMDMDESSTGEGSMDEGSMDEGSMGDVPMTMHEVSSIDIPAGGSVSLEPGGLHVMLLDLPSPLELGDTFDITFATADGAEFSVAVEVRDDAP